MAVHRWKIPPTYEPTAVETTCVRTGTPYCEATKFPNAKIFVNYPTPLVPSKPGSSLPLFVIIRLNGYGGLFPTSEAIRQRLQSSRANSGAPEINLGCWHLYHNVWVIFGCCTAGCLQPPIPMRRHAPQNCPRRYLPFAKT